jgi:putative SOS response-associated peptidase YedK
MMQLLAPAPKVKLNGVPVSPRVDSSEVDDAQCVEPVDEDQSPDGLVPG